MPTSRFPLGVVCDRDGTLVEDVPYNGHPDRVRPLPGVAVGLARLRAAGIALAVASNQSGVARGRLTPDEVEAVNDRVDELLGPFGAVVWCPHGPFDGCGCRKPAPGLVLAAAERLGVAPADCAVIGDIRADVAAAEAAGAVGILVPTARTRRSEVAAARHLAPDFLAAADSLLAGDFRRLK